jgi:hypothetical protein
VKQSAGAGMSPEMAWPPDAADIPLVASLLTVT